MIIGSGPIVIGQAAEFDYAGTQACRALRSHGIEVVLVNPNPATIMTDKAMADRIYIEPLTLAVLRRIIIKEKPDGLLSTMGGQSGLTLSMQLASDGFLEAHGVTLLGASLDTINKAEDRLLFKQTMESIGQPVIPSEVVTDAEAAIRFAGTIGYPVIVRPAFTLGGSGGGIVCNDAELLTTARSGLEASPIGQVLIEKSVAGTKEIEFEVMRDGAGNAIAVCSMENVDPVGIHTGDSIVIAPAITLATPEYQMLRTAALDIIHALRVEGGCNVQFALDPHSANYFVIEVNPRVSRSSALASKATGYPIAKVAAQIAIGFRLDEIENAVTGKTSAFFEPALDYVVVKMPKWPFDKFLSAKRTLGTQMKATGEVMAIAPTFEHALMKAVRGAEIGMDTPRLKRLSKLGDAKIESLLHEATDERLFVVYEALYRGIDVATIHGITAIDPWFLHSIDKLAAMERCLAASPVCESLYADAKRLGFLDASIERLSKAPCPAHLAASYRMVDTCAAEFEAVTPYFYAAYGGENEAKAFIAQRNSQKRRIVVFGSGPIRIGQGIEFDYASVHCVRTLRDLGYEVVMVNNNPETVSTDFDTADRLYFEPLTAEDVMDILETEQPYGVVVAFGGQTAIKLTRHLAKTDVLILGTSADAIDLAEDRERFDEVLCKLDIKRPAGHSVHTLDQALDAARSLGYPVLVRPSYVLGGQNMIIAYGDEAVSLYMDIILANGIDNPVLIDKYLMGTEMEVDAICDGEDVLIPGIMEHVERAGIHSGDSIAIYPAVSLSGPLMHKLLACTKKLSVALGTRGLINIQFVVHENELYVIEANPRASRTIPYISKVTGIPVVELATRAMLGERVSEMGFGTGLYREAVYNAVKVPVFSFEKLTGVDTHLGPEMKSTGEVLGLGKTLEEALYKGLLAAGYRIVHRGGALFTVRDRDKAEMVSVARKYHDLGFTLYASYGTSEALTNAGIPSIAVGKMYEGKQDIPELIDGGQVQYVVSTSSEGELSQQDSILLRRRAIERRIPCLTSIDTANALADAIASGYNENNVEIVDIANLRTQKTKLHFVKMRGSGNDYIYFDCFEAPIDNPESLAVWLCDRRKGVGGDGIILIDPSTRADAAMRIYNADGTQGEVAGNALRCVAKYLYEQRGMNVTKMRIATGSGVKDVELFVRDGSVFSVLVHMGVPDFASEAVPVLLPGPVLDREVSIGGEAFRVTCLSMGNPHCVIFTDDVDGVDLLRIGPMIENAALFPKRVNVSFAAVVDATNIRMRVWDRGIGETFASGSAACAVVAAATELRRVAMDRDIVVQLRGGKLVIHRTTGGITMTGDAKKDFEGIIEV
jgi:carbamoyl-phosphate synthase large subunit